EDRGFCGLDRRDVDPRRVPLERGRHPARRRRGADAVDERIHAAAGLGPDLLAEGAVAGDAIDVLQLIREPRAGRRGEGARGVDHVEDQLLRGQAALAGHEGQLGAERRHVVRFSWLNASEVTMRMRYPRAAHTSASDVPVLPPVYSTTVPPGRR